MKDIRPRVKVPASVKAGEAFTVKTLINHPMISGFTKDKATGKTIPREIINHFSCDFEGQNVIEMQLDPAVSANPYIEFLAKVDKSGTMTFTWKDDDGAVYTKTAAVTVG